MELLNKLLKGDKVIWVIFFLLCAISIVEVFSAASTMTYKSGNHWAPITSHILFLAAGAVLVWVIHLIPYKWFKIFPVFMIPLSLALMISISAMGYLNPGSRINGAARWSEVLGFSFQPSEFTKMGVVIVVAYFLALFRDATSATPRATKWILGISLPSIIIIAVENLSTAMLLFAVVYLMLFIGKINHKQQLWFSGFILSCAFLGSIVLFATPEGTKLPLLHRMPTWKNRIVKFMDSEKIPAAKFDIDNDAQAAHANIAIAQSHLVGKMPGNSVQRDFLSFAFSDFIYAIIIEELGLIGGIVVIFLYLWLLIRAGRIASRCEKLFPALLVIGIALLLVGQATLNMMVAVGLFPITGQPLPLISKGGTSTLVNCVYIGMILSVSRYTILLAEKRKREQEEEELARSLEIEFQQMDQEELNLVPVADLQDESK